MSTDTPEKRGKKTRVLMQYRKEDFSLYLLSLCVIFLVGVAVWKAFEAPSGFAPYVDDRLWYAAHPFFLAAFAAALIYLPICFLLRRGAARDSRFAATVFKGGASYAKDFAVLVWGARRRTIRLAIFFAVIVVIEQLLLRPLAGTFWARPFPWALVVALQFFVPTAYRTVMLVAHMMRLAHIREVLDQSPVRAWLRGMSMWNHVLQAYVTGVVCHVCLVAPCIVFYAATKPTFLREALLLVAYYGFGAVERTLKLQPELPLFFNNFYRDHADCHFSRFAFTMSHGHHHDTIPSGLAAIAEAGPLESAGRSVWYGWFLESIIATNFYFTWLAYRGMRNHQYIPGVFPYSRYVISICTHHVLHHFWSLYPLGFYSKFTPEGAFYAHRNDGTHGYTSDNKKIRWYLDLVAKYERLDDDERALILAGPTVVLGEEFDVVHDPVITRAFEDSP